MVATQSVEDAALPATTAAVVMVASAEAAAAALVAARLGASIMATGVKAMCLLLLSRG